MFETIRENIIFGYFSLENGGRNIVRSVCNCAISKAGQTAILVRWSAAQRTAEMIVQRNGKNSGPAPADYRSWASAIPLFWIMAYFWKYFKEKKLLNNGVDTDTDTDTAE
jgi:hypothetical protein